jgi:hypothetical protein
MSESSRTPSETKPNPKDAHLSELNAELARWQQEKEKLVARAASTGGPARAKLEEDLRDLDRGFEDARSALMEAEKSPAKRWVQAKARADDAFQALRDKVHQLKSP